MKPLSSKSPVVFDTWLTLARVLLLGCLYVGVYIFQGGLVLFLCKLAQSNIMPTEIHCSPYSDRPPTVSDADINAFPTWNRTKSAKMKFPWTHYNRSHFFLDLLRQSKEQASFITMYFISILEHVFTWNYQYWNTVMQFFHAWVPEIGIILLSPFILAFSLAVLVVTSYCTLFYRWFAEMSWFFKHKTNDGEWKPFSPLLHPFKFVTALICVSTFFWGFFFGLPFMAVTPFVVIPLVLISMWLYRPLFQGTNIHALEFVRLLFQFHQPLVMFLIAAMTVFYVYQHLGLSMALGTAALVVWSALGMSYFQLFQGTMSLDNWTPLTIWDQAEKVCHTEIDQQRHGFFNRLFFGPTKK